MAPQASKKCGLPPDHQQIGCCTSNGIDSEQIPAFSSSSDRISYNYEAPFNARKPHAQRCEYDARIGLRGSRSSRLDILCSGGTHCPFILSSSDTEATDTG